MSHPVTGPAAEETYPEIRSWVYSVSREREVELLRQEVRNPLQIVLDLDLIRSP